MKETEGHLLPDWIWFFRNQAKWFSILTLQISIFPLVLTFYQPTKWPAVSCPSSEPEQIKGRIRCKIKRQKSFKLWIGWWWWWIKMMDCKLFDGVLVTDLQIFAIIFLLLQQKIGIWLSIKGMAKWLKKVVVYYDKIFFYRESILKICHDCDEMLSHITSTNLRSCCPNWRLICKFCANY